MNKKTVAAPAKQAKYPVVNIRVTLAQEKRLCALRRTHKRQIPSLFRRSLDMALDVFESAKQRAA